jgi:hypothetical protein
MFLITASYANVRMMRIIRWSAPRRRSALVAGVAFAAATVSPAATAGGQVAPAGTSVSGVVYDSVARRPLAGADVELAESGAQRTIARRARSDSAGRFEISDVRAGRYLIGFYHPILDSLSLELPVRTLDVGVAPVRVSLGVPSLATISAALCPSTHTTDSTATLFGRVYDAEALSGLPGTAVSIWWRELVVANGAMRERRPRATATTSDDGGFAFCAVPANMEFAITAVRGADSTGLVVLSLEGGNVTRRDLFVGRLARSDSAPARRSALRGRVKTSDGQPLADASIGVDHTGQVARTDGEGRFEVAVAPTGTQRLDVRHVGYAPESRPVDLVAGRIASVDVTLVSMKQLMDTVRVTASRVYDADSDGFQKRRKSGLGYYFGPEDVERRHITQVSDLFRGVPSVTIRDEGLDRVVVMRDFFSNGYCRPTVFIDGMRLTDMDVTDIDTWVRPENLAGLEVYNSAERAPMQYTTLEGCGALVLWTRRGSRPKRD